MNQHCSVTLWSEGRPTPPNQPTKPQTHTNTSPSPSPHPNNLWQNLSLDTKTALSCGSISTAMLCIENI